MKIAIVVNGFPLASESFIFNKVMALYNANIDVNVLANSSKNDLSLYVDRLTDGWNKRVIYAPSAYGTRGYISSMLHYLVKHPKQSISLYKKAFQLYGNSKRAISTWIKALPLVLNKYDIVHFEFSGLAVSYIDVLPLLESSKLIMSCRGAAEQITPLIRPEREKMLRHVISYMDRIHCVSEDMMHTVIQYGMPPEKGFVNYPSIDVLIFKRQSPYPFKDQGPYNLLTTARLHWKKGLEYGLSAIRYLVDQGHLVTYNIIGSGPAEEAIRFTIHDLNLSRHVILHGKQSGAKIRSILETTDVYVHPSVSEGISNAVLEAMAMEVPVVSSNAGGMTEVITDGIEGYIVPSRHPFDMANRIADLLVSPDKRLMMGRNARERIINNFQLDIQKDKFIKCYKEMLAPPLDSSAHS